MVDRFNLRNRVETEAVLHLEKLDFIRSQNKNFITLWSRFNQELAQKRKFKMFFFQNNISKEMKCSQNLMFT